MQKFLVAASVTLHTGTLELSDAQYARRKHALKKVGKGKYEILAPVQFKVGEEISYEGEIPKALATVLIDEAEAKKDTTKKAKAEAAAKAKSEAEQEEKLKAIEDEIKALQAELAKAQNPEAKSAVQDKIDARFAELDELTH
jgi:hypothetical protein